MESSLECILEIIFRRIFMQAMANSQQISINNLGIVNGYLPPKALSLVVEWASIHQQELLENWQNLNEAGNGNFTKYEPLK